MSIPHAIPIIVGVGDFRNKSTDTLASIEPSRMMIRAIQLAAQDTGLTASAQETLLLGRADSLRIVPTWTWAYDDLPAAVANGLGLRMPPENRVLLCHGGHQPAQQCDEAARAIAQRKSTVAIIAGGEAMASLAACQKANQLPPPGWTEPDPNSKSAILDLPILTDGPGPQHSMGLPIHIYPLYEMGRRAQLGQTAQQNHEESATMYASFDKIASENPNSWNYGDKTKSAAIIGSVSDKNRIIYPLLMTAFNSVNLSAACILTSTEYADNIGIPKDKWVYVLGGAGTCEREKFWERPAFTTSSAITSSLDSALQMSGLKKQQIDVFDLYSCFPIVPKLACDHLGLSCTRPEKPISLLGGLTSFGGAGNNYSMHALTAMTRVLRSHQYTNGLVLANGGMLLYQHAVCLSAQPRQDEKAYPEANPLSPVVPDLPPPFVQDANGPAKIETYTVEYDRTGRTHLGLIVGRLQTGERFLANHGDESTLNWLAGRGTEHIGELGVVRKEEERNRFYFDARMKL